MRKNCFRANQIRYEVNEFQCLYTFSFLLCDRIEAETAFTFSFLSWGLARALIGDIESHWAIAIASTRSDETRFGETFKSSKAKSNTKSAEIYEGLNFSSTRQPHMLRHSKLTLSLAWMATICIQKHFSRARFLLFVWKQFSGFCCSLSTTSVVSCCTTVGSKENKKTGYTLRILSRDLFNRSSWGSKCTRISVRCACDQLVN